MRAVATLSILAVTITVIGSTTAAQELSFREMRWRDIGPTRAGRARALAGVASQPNTFYAGFDNGGVWRSTDYGANWVPLFDDQSTGSIGAIAVAPSNPDVIYVGTGAGIIRPDLAIGDGMYKSTDAGKTWTHIGLERTMHIGKVAIDQTDPNRVYVAALGDVYGPSPDRGLYRSLDGGAHWKKMLFKANDPNNVGAIDVAIDPKNPRVLYASLWATRRPPWRHRCVWHRGRLPADCGNWQPQRSDYPVLIVKGVNTVKFGGSLFQLTQSSVSYPSEMRGLVHLIGTNSVELNNAFYLFGCLVADGTITTSWPS